MASSDMSWFQDFAVKLIRRSLRTDWPSFKTPEGIEFWSNFCEGLAQIDAQQDEADRASTIACNSDDLYLNQYRPLIVAEIRTIQAQKRSRTAGYAPSPGEVDPRDCPSCRGAALLLRYIHPDHAGLFRTPKGHPLPIGSVVSLRCTCAAGRAMAANLPSAADFPGMLCGPVAWSDEPDTQYLYHPDNWNSDEGRPVSGGTARPVQVIARGVTASGKAPHRPKAWRSTHGRDIEPPAVPDRLSELVERREAEARQPAAYPVLGGGEPCQPSPEEEAEAAGWF